MLPEQKILQFLQNNPQSSFKSKDILRELHIRADQRDEAHGIMQKLVASGAIGKKGNKYFARAVSLTGTLSINKAGEGFVTVEGYDEDFFISPSRLKTAMNKDTVMMIPYLRKRTGKRPEGEIIGVVERARTRIVGTVDSTGDFFVVIPDDRRLRRDIYVAAEKTNGAKHGQKVVVALEKWDDPSLNPEGAVVEIIGYPGEKGVDVLSVVKQHDIHFDFPNDVEVECARIPAIIPEDEITRRLDFREALVFTIDPFDAKDFDDAISIDQGTNGNTILGVHIADVSYYVRENTALDREAYKRGTSTYLVDQVTPMLPEKLSNELCSLRPNEDKLTYSCFMEIDAKGYVVDYDVVETVIHSKRRFTYEEVQQVIEGKLLDNLNPDVKQAVMDAYALSKRLTKKRMTEGSIDFDTPETKFKLDENGVPIECYRKERLDAHRLIEEFMLLANQYVSKHIGLSNKKNELPFLYRVHDKPVKEKFENFVHLMKVLGHAMHLPKSMDLLTPKHVQKVIASVKGSKEDNLIEKVAIRSMAKAEYSDKNIGHFGLAFDYYSHFTSPIRRYPDLIVHRMLKEYDAGMSAARIAWWASKLPEMARHCSDRERVATEAERDSIKVKQAEFIERFLGEEFDGIVSGVIQYGIFVEISQYLIEGLIHVRDLKGDYYVFDEKNYRLTGQRRKTTFRLGDRIRIKVARVNREKREVDFTIVE